MRERPMERRRQIHNTVSERAVVCEVKTWTCMNKSLITLIQVDSNTLKKNCAHDVRTSNTQKHVCIRGITGNYNSGYFNWEIKNLMHRIISYSSGRSSHYNEYVCKLNFMHITMYNWVCTKLGIKSNKGYMLFNKLQLI